MGLLRAAAEIVLIGSGTLQASPNGLWTPESTYPDAADGWAELRRRLGRPPEPALAVITGSGGVDPNHPAFERGALVLTTDAGAQALSGLLPAASEVVALGDGPLVDVGRAVEEVRGRGHELVVLEAGPHVVGSMLGEQLVDELFLTVSPRLFGRYAADNRKSLVDGVDLAGALTGLGLTLASVRRHESYLFLRYGR